MPVHIEHNTRIRLGLCLDDVARVLDERNVRAPILRILALEQALHVCVMVRFCASRNVHQKPNGTDDHVETKRKEWEISQPLQKFHQIIRARNPGKEQTLRDLVTGIACLSKRTKIIIVNASDNCKANTSSTKNELQPDRVLCSAEDEGTSECDAENKVCDCKVEDAFKWPWLRLGAAEPRVNQSAVNVVGKVNKRRNREYVTVWIVELSIKENDRSWEVDKDNRQTVA